MKEAFQLLVMKCCLVGLGGITVTFLMRYAVPWIARHAVAGTRRYFRLGFVGMLSVGLVTGGMILHGGGKNDATNSPALPPNGLDELVVDPPEGGFTSTTRVEKWSRRGAWEDGHFVQFENGWVFPFASNHLASVEIWSQGKIFQTEKSLCPIAELMTPLALAPGNSEVIFGHTMNNSYRFEWVAAHPNRDANVAKNASIELFRNGDFETTENGVTTHHNYVIPFAHDGIGQDEDWVRANFTNAAEIISIGYTNWVDGQVGVNLTNGFYKFTAHFAEVPPEPTRFFIGNYSVVVTNAGEYVFVLDKGTEYEFGTWPTFEDVNYWAQDDLGDDAPMLMSLSAPWDTQGEWTIDGGWKWLYYPYGGFSGNVCWLPRLQGSPAIPDLSPGDFPKTFTAIVTDHPCPDALYYEWSSSNPGVHIDSPHSRQTSVSIDSAMVLLNFNLSVSTIIGRQYLCSYVGTGEHPKEDAPGVRLFLDVPAGIPIGSSRFECGFVLDCDVETNGWMVLEFDAGANRVSLWGDVTNNTAFAYSNRVFAATRMETRFFVHGENLSQSPEDVNWRLSFISDTGTTNSVCRSSTVYECYCEPITIETVSGNILYNPSFIGANTNALFKVSTVPTTIPETNVTWRVVQGSAVFVGSSVGKEVRVSGGSGMVDLEVNVLGSTDERMHFKAKVTQ